MLGFKKNKLDQMNQKSLKKARRDLEVKYDIAMGTLETASTRYEGYKRAAAEEGRTNQEIERAALEMASWSKKRKTTLKNIREIQLETRAIDSFITRNEMKDQNNHGVWSTINKMSVEEVERDASAIATLIKEKDNKLTQVTKILDNGLEDIVIEAEKDADEQKAIDEIYALRQSNKRR